MFLFIKQSWRNCPLNCYDAGGCDFHSVTHAEWRRARKRISGKPNLFSRPFFQVDQLKYTSIPVMKRFGIDGEGLELKVRLLEHIPSITVYGFTCLHMTYSITAIFVWDSSLVCGGMCSWYNVLL